VKEYINYGTFGQLSDKNINATYNIREMSEEILKN